MKKTLPRTFFERPVLRGARDLLGKFLVRRWRGRNIAAMITEVEAYDGPHDKASHASRGKTARNAPMFGEAGCWYVYFTYGMHWMLNIVTGPAGYPAAVLIRAAKCVGADGAGSALDGPGKLTRSLHVGKRLNGKAARKRTGLWIEDRGVRIKPPHVIARKRVGVDYAGAWAEKLYNFSIHDAPDF